MKHSQKMRKEQERKHKKEKKIKKESTGFVLPYDRKSGKINRCC